jgi:hypothetical protein
MADLDFNLVDAFLLICEEEGSSASIEAIRRNAAFEKISSGEIRSLVSSSLNGKSFNYNLSATADIVFNAASRAIRIYNRGIIKATEVDFSGI